MSSFATGFATTTSHPAWIAQPARTVIILRQMKTAGATALPVPTVSGRRVSCAAPSYNPACRHWQM